LPERFDLDLEGRLLAADSRRVPLYRFDVVVVGSGIAGGAAARAAAAAGAEVAVLAKSDLLESNTLYAQGGMAAVLGVDDSFEAHVADTLAVGCGLSERTAVERVVRGGPEAVRHLIEWGASFDQRADGSLALSREGGHSKRRVVHAHGDSTGREIQGALVRGLQSDPHVTPFSGHFGVDLLRGSGGRVVGLMAYTGEGRVAAFSASQVLLATGGAGQIYRETTNPAIATGDGVALALRAGALVRDLEFFQFHPTLLYIAGAARVLISEIVRGAGGVLRDRDGVRFMPEYHPDAELAPRDVVSRAAFERMVATGDTSVYLDLSDVEGDPHLLFPGISRICGYFGIDIAHDPVPVRPGAHYMIGGIEVDADGRTSVPGLWAAGECASTGLHGANRMGSNSLLEGLVLGARAGRGAAVAARGDGIELAAQEGMRARREAPSGVQVNIQDVTYSLKSLMWRQLGLERERGQMEDALAKIALWTRAVGELAPPEPRTWELVNMLTVAHLCAIGALAREESRGVHFRSDFPRADPAWRAHTRLRPVFAESRLAGVDVERVALPPDVPSHAAAATALR
jgi:L-aspartate oxidase